MKTYHEKDSIRKPIQWLAHKHTMLGTISEAGIIRRMDGSLVTVKNYWPANEKELEIFALTGQWMFEAGVE